MSWDTKIPQKVLKINAKTNFIMKTQIFKTIWYCTQPFIIKKKTGTFKTTSSGFSNLDEL